MSDSFCLSDLNNPEFRFNEAPKLKKVIRKAERKLTNGEWNAIEKKKRFLHQLYIDLYKQKWKRVELKIPYSYGGKSGIRSVGFINGPYLEIYRNSEHYCIKHRGFGISDAVLDHVVEKYPEVEWVFCWYDGKECRYILITRLNDFIMNGTRDKLSELDDAQTFLPEDRWRVKKTFENEVQWPVKTSRTFGKR